MISRDRADAVAHVVLQVVARHILDGGDSGGALHEQLADTLREEFADVARTTLNEIRLKDG